LSKDIEFRSVAARWGRAQLRSSSREKRNCIIWRGNVITCLGYKICTSPAPFPPVPVVIMQVPSMKSAPLPQRIEQDGPAVGELKLTERMRARTRKIHDTADGLTNVKVALACTDRYRKRCSGLMIDAV
jgi:hypothetical protein